MADFRSIRIGDLGRVVTGKTPPSAQHELFGDIFPFLTPTDIDGFTRHIEPGRYLSAAGGAYQHRLMLPSCAVCVVCIGATIGKVCMTDRPSFTNQQINSVVLNEDKYDPFFVCHLLGTLRDELKSNAGGAATPIINKTAFSEIKVNVPPLLIQRRIAGILSTYDELIENSQRRIKILEAMARGLYREWFVAFRFPGCESVPSVPSSLGKIPLGWEVSPLRAVTTKIGSGATPRGGKDAYKTEGIHLIRSLNIYDYNFKFADLALIDEKQGTELANVVIEENDILLNITGASVGRCTLVPTHLLPARVNQHVAIIRADPTKASPFYVLDSINSEQPKQQLLALAQGGATREALTKDTISNFQILLPPHALMQSYHAVARDIHKQREALQRQIQNLRCTRDLLLPRLLSGQVELKPEAA